MNTRRLALLACAVALIPTTDRAHAALSLYVTPEDLARQAAVVVEGQVTRTATGLDPQAGTLATYVGVRVEAVHRGPQDLDQIVLRELGGRFGEFESVIDAVPLYEAGERVFLFLDVAPDGALRTSGMFFGKFTLDSTREQAVRELDGQGRIASRPEGGGERFSRADLAALAAGATSGATTHGWHKAPNEYSRLIWDDERLAPVELAEARGIPGRPLEVAPVGRSAGAAPDFAPLVPSTPARWMEADAGEPIRIAVDPRRNPLGDDQAALAAIEEALLAWNTIPEARVELQIGEIVPDWPTRFNGSPATTYHAENVVLFGDPWEQIADPIGCSGVLAIGGYWRSTGEPRTINGRQFWAAHQVYVIFNNGLECFLGNSENLAEVAAHELGHGLGFGHSGQVDSIMRPFPYGQRGARLGSDEMDAAHCHYPHSFELPGPAAGQVWVAGSRQEILWTATHEVGQDNATVDIQISRDAGATWRTIASGARNDGRHTWTVDEAPGTNLRLRLVRPLRQSAAPSGYPNACSGALAQFPIRVVAPRRAPQSPVGVGRGKTRLQPR